MEILDLTKILHGDIDHIEQVNESDEERYGMRVVIKPIDVKKMLLRYLNGKI